MPVSFATVYKEGPGVATAFETSARHNAAKILESSSRVCPQVDYFVILSGFVTHWAARGRFAGALDLGACKRWWARRFGRVLLSCWLAMAFSAALLKASGGDVAPGHVARCFLLVESWRDPNRWCPDGQTWTVAALAPCWLLCVRRADMAPTNRGGAAAGTWIVRGDERRL